MLGAGSSLKKRRSICCRRWAWGHFEMNFPRRFTRWMRPLRCCSDRWYFASVRRITKA